MKFTFIIFLIFLQQNIHAQKHNFEPVNLSLPSEISYYDNQFSGLYIQHNNLYVMSESRLQDSAEAKIYSITLADLDKKLIDSSYKLPFKKLPIYNLQNLRQQMQLKGDEYEGLEAIIVQNNKIYLSVETSTPSNNCYLLNGIINDTAVILNNELLALPKPVTSNGEHVYNAGFEAIAYFNGHVFSFFEYNYFSKNNAAKMAYPGEIDLPIKKIPFRITDITQITKKTYTAINYFYKGEGKDEVYRVDNSDANFKLIYDSTGYHSYCRLIEIKERGNSFTFKPLWEFPKSLMAYNWEGLTAYKNGYFIINDKYTPTRPYSTVLLYLKPIK